MINGLMGKKLGMTQIFENDRSVPVSVIEAGPVTVVNKREKSRDGYQAVQLGFGEKKEKQCTKPITGYFTKIQLKPMIYLREFFADKPEEYQVGQTIGVDIFQKGEYVNVSGISKGKGFQGVMKRHRAHGGPNTHGGMSHRRIGSVGQSSFPSRIFKGHIMPGQMGNEKKTVLNLEIVKVDPAKNLILVKGAIPGSNNSLVIIRKTGRVKKEQIKAKVQGDSKAKMVKQARKAAAAKK